MKEIIDLNNMKLKHHGFKEVNMKNILLIWDVDGTLIDSKGCGRRAMDKAFFSLYNIKDGFKDVCMAGRLDWHIVRDALKINNIKDSNISYFLNVYKDKLKEELSMNTCAVVLPGIKEILEETSKQKNIYHALGTGNCEKGARLKLSHLGLERYFKIGGFGDEDINRWELIEKVIKKAEEYYKVTFEKENIYVIGDTPLDIECGKKLGIKSIAVATGRHGYDELLNHNPDYIFHSFSGFMKFMEVINKIQEKDDPKI